MALSQDDKLLVVALDLLRRQIHDSAMGSATNTQRSEGDFSQQASEIASFLQKKGYGPPAQTFTSPTLGEKPAPDSAPAKSTPDAKQPNAPAGTPDPVVEELKGIREEIKKLPTETAIAFGAAKRYDPDQADATHAGSKSKYETLGFGRDEGFGGSRIPRALGLGSGLGLGEEGASNLRGNRGPGKSLGATSGLVAAPVLKVMGDVATKFAAIIGPAAILGQVLNNNLSGFQILGTSVKVLATTIAPVLLPATVALSAGVLALSDVIMEHGMPVMDSWFGFVLGTAIPAITFLVDSFDDGAKGVRDFAETVGEAVAWVERQISSLNPFSDDDNTDERRIAGLKWSDRGSGERGVQNGLADTLRSLRQSMGPKASIGGLGDVGRQVQLAGLNADPLEARMLKVQQDMLARLDRIAGNTEGRRRQRGAYGPLDPLNTGRGDYEGGLSGGSSGDYGGDE